MTGAGQQVEARRETGGPHPAADERLAPDDIEARIAALDALATADLRIKWRKLYRAEPASRLSHDLLVRGIAYKLQEQQFGGLSLTTKRRLLSLGGGSEDQGSSPIALKPGAKLVREWHGKAYTVTVLEKGFDYQGERYPSLTGIARRITGAHWSGPLFFGIGKRSLPMTEAAHE